MRLKRSGLLPKRSSSPGDEIDRLAHRLEGTGRDAHAVLPSAPVRPLAEARLEVPRMALEPGRPLPRAHVPVHARRRLAQRLEAGGIGRGRLLASLPGIEDHVARTRQVAVLDGLNELPVVASDGRRRDRRAALLERDLPRELGGDGGPRVVAFPVHAQRPLPPALGVVHAIGRVLRQIDQLQDDAGRQGKAMDGPLRESLQPAQQLLVRKLSAARHPVSPKTRVRRRSRPPAASLAGALDDTT